MNHEIGADGKQMSSIADLYVVPHDTLFPVCEGEISGELAGFLFELHQIASGSIDESVAGARGVVTLALEIEDREASILCRTKAVVQQLPATQLRGGFVVDGCGTLRIEQRPDFCAESARPFEAAEPLEAAYPGLSVSADMLAVRPVPFDRDLAFNGIRIPPTRRLARTGESLCGFVCDEVRHVRRILEIDLARMVEPCVVDEQRGKQEPPYLHGHIMSADAAA